MSDHKRDAEGMLQYSSDMNPEATPERAMHAVALAQVHATLALVEQQHLANLIAYSESIAENQRDGHVLTVKGAAEVDAIEAQIREGLAL